MVPNNYVGYGWKRNAVIVYVLSTPLKIEPVDIYGPD